MAALSSPRLALGALGAFGALVLGTPAFRRGRLVLPGLLVLLALLVLGLELLPSLANPASFDKPVVAFLDVLDGDELARMCLLVVLVDSARLWFVASRVFDHVDVAEDRQAALVSREHDAADVR